MLPLRRGNSTILFAVLILTGVEVLRLFECARRKLGPIPEPQIHQSRESPVAGSLQPEESEGGSEGGSENQQLPGVTPGWGKRQGIPYLQPFKPRAGIDQRFVLEKHHSQYGRPWGMGRDIFTYLTQAGMKPSDVLLDYGCGALRNGIWIIPYLDEGHYFGVEYDPHSYNAGRLYEIPLHNLQSKRPTLFNNHEDGLPHILEFNKKFDRILAFAVLIHVKPSLRKKILAEMAQSLTPDGTLHISHHLPFSEQILRQEYLLEVVHRSKQPCTFIDDNIAWFDLKLVQS